MLEQNRQHERNFFNAISEEATILLCPVVYFEMQRGLEQRNATGQLRAFNRLITTWQWDDFIRSDWVKASQVWVHMTKQGYVVDEADLMIGIFTFRHEAILVTHNVRHFEQMKPYLQFEIQNWLE